MNGISQISLAELRLLAPMLVVTVTGIAVLMLEVFQRSAMSRRYQAWLSVIGLGMAGLDTLYLLARGTEAFAMSQLLYMDGFGFTLDLVVLLGGALAALIAPAYLESHRLERGEYYGLVLFSVVGMMVMNHGADLFTIFMGLELMSIPIYCLAGYFRHSSASAESSMKYFFLGAFASALFLYGIAFVYGMTGTTSLVGVSRVMFSGLGSVDVAGAEAYAASSGFVEYVGLGAEGGPLFALEFLPAMAVLLILAAMAFKVAVVPFHAWTPDVYSGAPSSVVGFMATGVKTAAFGALVRVFMVGFFDQPARLSETGWLSVFFWLALISMVLGNVVAIVQSSVKRMLAYSSIAHAGYIMVGVVGASYSPEGFLQLESVLFYLLTYTLGTVGAFGVLAWFGKRGEEATTYEDLAGVAKKYPGAALAMTIFMLSSAGIPPTAGFMGKFYVFKAAVQTGETAMIALAVVGVLASVSGVYYYLKVIMAMYMKTPRREVHGVAGLELKTALVVCAMGTLLLGILPGIGLGISRAGVLSFLGAPPQVRVELNKLRAPVEAGRAELGAPE